MRAGCGHLGVTAASPSRLRGTSGRSRGGRAVTTVGDRVLRRALSGAERLNLVVADVLALGVVGIGGDALREDSFANIKGHRLLVVLNARSRVVGGASAVPLEVRLWQ